MKLEVFSGVPLKAFLKNHNVTATAWVLAGRECASLFSPGQQFQPCLDRVLFFQETFTGEHSELYLLYCRVALLCLLISLLLLLLFGWGFGGGFLFGFVCFSLSKGNLYFLAI